MSFDLAFMLIFEYNRNAQTIKLRVFNEVMMNISPSFLPQNKLVLERTYVVRPSLPTTDINGLIQSTIEGESFISICITFLLQIFSKKIDHFATAKLATSSSIKVKHEWVKQHSYASDYHPMTCPCNINALLLLREGASPLPLNGFLIHQQWHSQFMSMQENVHKHLRTKAKIEISNHLVKRTLL